MSEIDTATDILTEVSLDDPEPGDGVPSESPLITIGATVPTGFEFTAAAEVEEKLGCRSKISKDRGKIYFEISMDSLAQGMHGISSNQQLSSFTIKAEWSTNSPVYPHQLFKNAWSRYMHQLEGSYGCIPHMLQEIPSEVHRLRSVDNLFVVIQEFMDFPFKEAKEAALEDFKVLAAQLPWTKALKTWELNNNLKKKKKKRKPANFNKDRKQQATPPDVDGEDRTAEAGKEVETSSPQQEEASSDVVISVSDMEGDGAGAEMNNVLKFRVTCNRAGTNHSFTSNEAARDFGGAVQEHFQWKADMTKFDVEVLLNISNNEMLVGIALTEESLHRRNITHFGPTTLRSTLAYGMLRLCELEVSDVIVDPMCGTGAIPLEGVSEWPGCFFIAGDNNGNAVNRTASNICSLLKKQQNPESGQGLPIDAAQWDISRLPLRSGSVDVIITDMPFGKRIGSKKKNWDLYPACLREMSRVCRAGTGRAVLLTHDKKCFIKALSKMGHLWRKMHTVWVNIGGLHAGVYLLKRTTLDVSDISSERLEENHPLSPE